MRLTPEEINRRIAIACGKTPWLYCKKHGEISTERALIGRSAALCPWCNEWLSQEDQPNYFASLDACAEFEATLKGDESVTYCNHLTQVKGRPSFVAYFASASERCHAFCLLRGLIKDGEEWPE